MSDDLDIDTADVESYVSQSLDQVTTLKELGFIYKGVGKSGIDNNKSHWLRKLGRGWY